MKARKFIKRVLLGIGILLGVLIAAAILIPIIFKDRIIETVKEEVNNNVNAKVDFADVDISLFRDFPRVSLGLEELSVVGVEQFENVPLAAFDEFSASVNIMDLVNNVTPMRIHSITLDKPNIHVVVLKDGTANYDIAKASETVEEETSTTETAAFQLKLEEYAINDGHLIYDDHSTGTYLEIDGLNHTGTGNIDATVFDLETHTHMDGLTAKSGGVAYLSDAVADADINLNIDTENSIFKIKENRVNLNALEVNVDGQVAMPNDSDIAIDLTFDAPSTQFKSLLSMIPGAFTKDFESVKTDGTFKLAGAVKGTYNEQDIPAFNADLDVANAYFQYPDLPMGLKNINTNIKLNSPSSDLNQMALDINRLHFDLGDNPFDVVFKLRTPISDPNVDTKIKGKLDLADLSKAFPMEGVDHMSGIIEADVQAKAAQSQIDKEQYQDLNMSGNMSVASLNYKPTDMPSVLIKTGDVDFSPKFVAIDNFDAELGSSVIQADGRIDNILAYFSPELTMKGAFNVRSAHFDANEWMNAGPSEPTAPTPNAEVNQDAPTTEEQVFDRFDFQLNADLKEILYEKYKIENTKAVGHFTPNRFALNNFETKIGNSDLKAKGELDNVFDYLYNYETIKGSLKVDANRIDANELLALLESSSTSSAPTTTAEAVAPTDNSAAADAFDRFRFALDAKIGELNYENYDVKNINASGAFQPEQFALRQFKANLGGSDLSASGTMLHIKEYLFENGTLDGAMSFRSNKLDLNELMAMMPTTETSEAATSAASSETTGAVLLPKDIALDFSATIGKLIYDNIEMKNMNGKMDLKDAILSLHEVSANTMGGQMKIDGKYDTSDPAKPFFDFGYHVEKFSFGESFQKFNTLDKIAPVGKLIEGIFNSEMRISGLMNEDMSPNFSTLNGSMALETIDGYIKSLKPLEKIASQIKYEKLAKGLSVKDTWNKFEIKEGKVFIDPFKFEHDDIRSEISGNHAIDGDMDYKIRVHLPKDKLGNLGAKGLGMLGDQAAKLGLDFGQSAKYIDFDIFVKGSVTSPKTSFKLVGMSGEGGTSTVENIKEGLEDKAEEELDKVKEKAQEEVDKLKDKAQEEVDKVKDKVQEEVDKVQDKVKDKVQEEVDKVKDKLDDKVDEELDKVKDQVGDQVNDKVEEVKDKIGDEIKDKVGEEVNDKVKEVEDKLKDWNPFKKKKKKEEEKEN